MLQPFDTSSFITVPEPTPRLPTKMSKHGVPGDTEDMLPVFDACLRVGKLERAAIVLKRLNSLITLPAEQRIVLNNSYLRASLLQMRTTPDQNQAEKLHQWYELHIRGNGLPHTAETIACMLKASLLSERGTRLDRLVKRYMGMAPDEAGLRVLSMADILSDQDLAVITDICPRYNFTADPETDEYSLDDGSEMTTTTTPLATPGMPTSIPQLVPTPQRGEGLATLMKGLNFLSAMEDIDISKLPIEDQKEVQLQLERDAVSAAILKWRYDHKKMQKMGINTAIGGNKSEEGSLTQHMGSWLDAMELRLKDELTAIAASEAKENKSEVDLSRCVYGPVLAEADPARLAAVTILSVLNLGTLFGADKGIAVSKLINHVAKSVQEDIIMQRKKDKKKEARKRKVQLNAAIKTTGKLSTRPLPVLINDNSASELAIEESVRNTWSAQVRAQIGAILLKALVDTAKVKVTMQHPTTSETISQFQPAFTHMQQTRKGKKAGVLLLNSFLVERLKTEPLGDYLAKHLPMVVQPKPWRRMNDGGFLEGKTSFVRVKPGDIEQKMYTKAAIKTGDLKHVFKGLDVLGKTAWRINKQLLAVMSEAWNSGEKIANMPPLSPQFSTPPEPNMADDPSEHRLWRRSVKAIENERSGLHSQRCFMNLQLEIARSFRNQTIYFPHNVDYRGRAYPIPTYLNHMGADHTRGLLYFAKGKPLGARGLRWLKIHLANVYGLDKASFDDREAFANERVADIVDSASNPLNGRKWWLEAEEPWQCLAACFELKAALDLEDPTTYISHLPIQQDGTCNGLQHYAALGGDTWGARQVNLEPGDKPADVYSAVAELVKEGIAKDAEDGLPAALAVNGKITRKVVKQTVMTNVYGVTFAGAKKQVCKQVDALYPGLGKANGTTNIVLASYIARHIFTALATMFRGAHDIQYWLGEVGGRVCRALTPTQLQQISNDYAAESALSASKTKVKKTGRAKLAWSKPTMNELTVGFRSTVVWTTPLRMPVAQPYRKATTKMIRTCFQSVSYPVSDLTDPVNRKKQLQGFPPNFIHSLDASHMLLSALQCSDLGLTFAAVHDSFWTHAADIDTMNGVLREAFIQIHEEDVIGRLAAEFKARHEGSVYLAHIDPQTPVAKKISELRANSKLSPKEELLLEHKRNTLRLSGNPWDLEAAKQIVTPASVYEDMQAAEEDLEIKHAVEEISLGAIPDDVKVASSKSKSKQIQNEEMHDEDMDGMAEHDDDHNMSNFHAADNDIEDDEPVENPKVAPKKSVRQMMGIWLPLTIPDIPQKVCTPLSLSFPNPQN